MAGPGNIIHRELDDPIMGSTCSTGFRVSWDTAEIDIRIKHTKGRIRIAFIGWNYLSIKNRNKK
jgi:hypothetical protein